VNVNGLLHRLTSWTDEPPSSDHASRLVGIRNVPVAGREDRLLNATSDVLTLAEVTWKVAQPERHRVRRGRAVEDRRSVGHRAPSASSRAGMLGRRTVGRARHQPETRDGHHNHPQHESTLRPCPSETQRSPV